MTNDENTNRGVVFSGFQCRALLLSSLPNQGYVQYVMTRERERVCHFLLEPAGRFLPRPICSLVMMNQSTPIFRRCSGDFLLRVDLIASARGHRPRGGGGAAASFCSDGILFLWRIPSGLVYGG
jgi:hypothetical protein